jgi:hypothetical protein
VPFTFPSNAISSAYVPGSFEYTELQSGGSVVSGASKCPIRGSYEAKLPTEVAESIDESGVVDEGTIRPPLHATSAAIVNATTAA